MSDETDGKAPDNKPDPTLVKENTRLATELEKANGRVAELEATNGTLTNANQQLTTKVSSFETEITGLTSKAEELGAEVTNLTTAKAQIVEQLAGANVQVAELGAKETLFTKISSDHPGAVEMYKELADLVTAETKPEAIDALLGKFSGTIENKTKEAVSMFNAGGGTSSGSTNTPAAEPPGPKSIEEAWANLNNLHPQHDAEQWALNQQFIRKAQAEGGANTPN